MTRTTAKSAARTEVRRAPSRGQARPKTTRPHSTRPSTGRRTKTSNTRVISSSSTPFLVLLGLVVCFSLLGLTMVLSASSVTSLTATGSPWGEFKTQSVWLGMGALACLTTTFIDHKLLRRLTVPALLVSFGLLIMVLLPWFGVTVNGAQRWLRIGPIQFQPSEIAKLTLVLFAADNLARSKTVDVERSLRPILVVLMVYGGLILMQPNLGTTIIIFVIGISTLFASGIRLWVIAVLGTVSAVGAGLLAYLAPYRRDRLLAFLDPWSDPLDEGWQTIQSLVSVANGGVRGVGIGESRGKFGFLPEAHNDFVFAVTAEEFGLVGASVVVLGYVLFGLVALVIARRAERFGALLVIGIASWILVQAFINIGAVLGVMPITGVPLPFMSAGGTSLVTTLAGVGVMLNVARECALSALPTSVLIVGGGTAGHVLPGVAIGQALVRRGHRSESIHFVGSERGVERTLVPEAGFGLTVLPGRGIQRRLTRDNFGAVAGLIRAFAASFSLLRAHRPSVVVALGGYASVPAGLWAVLLRVPVVVAEQNAVPGLANRIIGRFAKVCAVSFDGTDLPRAVWTGNPVRPEVLAIGSTESGRAVAREKLGVDPARRLVVVFGGSLGARTINDAVVGALAMLADRKDLEIRHIIGSRDFADVSARVSSEPSPGVSYTPVEYERDMATVYEAADLVVCRAGATSCAELAVTGTPSVLVPLPGAPGDHQTANARALERAGGAEVLADSIFDAQLFADTVLRLLSDPNILQSMRVGAGRIARPDAADALADLVELHGAFQ